jgi:hypothetical protein
MVVVPIKAKIEQIALDKYGTATTIVVLIDDLIKLRTNLKFGLKFSPIVG